MNSFAPLQLPAFDPAALRAASADFAQKHPNAVRTAKIAGVAVVAGVATPIIVNSALGVVGFGPQGVAAGSIAAGAHASIGIVTAGSVFAACQSLGATGLGPAAAVAVGAAAGGLTSVVTRAKSESIRIRAKL